MDAISAVDNVRVAVDEARDSALPSGVDNFGVSSECHGGVHLVTWADGFNVASANRDCRVVNDAELSISIDGGEAGEVVDQKVGGLHDVSLRAAVDRLRALKRELGVQVTPEEIRSWIDDGKKL